MLALVLGLAGVTTVASARQLTLTVTPDPPTWSEVARLRVSGELVTPCGVSGLRLTNLRQTSIAGTQVVDVDLVDGPCAELATAASSPFTLEAELGHLPPGPATVRVHDLADGSVAARELVVRRVARVGLDVPRLAVSDQPVKVGVTHFETCGAIYLSVAGNVLTVFYDPGCPVEPLPPLLQRTELDFGPLAPGDYEVRLIDDFDTLRRLPLRVWDAAGCVPAEDSLCLHRGRFRVSATWRAFDGSRGQAHAAPLLDNEGSGLLWFFSPDNAELTVKVLDGCGVDGAWWAFLSSASTVEYEVTVTDTSSGSSRQYRKELGEVPALIADTGAFACP